MAGRRLEAAATRLLYSDVPVRAAAADAGAEPTHPWTLHDLRRLVRSLAVSITALAVAWLFASGTTRLSYQEYAIAGAIVGTAVAVAGLTGWLLAGVRALRAERARALTQVRAVLSQRAPAQEERSLGLPEQPAVGGAVSAPGMSRYHDSACLMVRGKPVHEVLAAEAAALAPCPICVATEAS